MLRAMTRRVWALAAVCMTLVAGCGQQRHEPTAPTGPAGTEAAAPRPSPRPGPGRGFPAPGPWVSYYGAAGDTDLRRMASTFRILNVDADPAEENFTPEDIAALRAGGRNRVLSYLNVGSVETFRDYWSRAPKAARLGAYQGYPDEVWMNPADRDWRRLLVDHVAARLVEQGVDGFYLDNLEVVEHDNCDRRCAQGGLDLVAELRAAYPDRLIVMQNATGDVTREGMAGGAHFALLLDGVAQEETFTTADYGEDAGRDTYRVQTDDDALAALLAWQRLGLRPGGRPLWIGTEDYVNTCRNATDAAAVQTTAAGHGFAPYVSDKSALQATVCYWSHA
jgi:cysteinyl-tRNA synthetase